MASAMGLGRGEEAGSRCRALSGPGGSQATARRAVREPQVPGAKPHNAHLLGRPQRTSHLTKEQTESTDRRDLPKVTQEGVEKLAARAPPPLADLSDDLQLENPAQACKTRGTQPQGLPLRLSYGP